MTSSLYSTAQTLVKDPVIQRDPPPVPNSADRADRYRLYQLSVQNPKAEISFVDRTFRALRGHSARLLREDFCGAGALCCEWVRRRLSNRAWGLDLDSQVIDWGHRHNLPELTDDQRSRIELVQQDVLTPQTRRPDIVLAMNFSYWLLQDRTSLFRYFQQVREALREGGVFFLDAYGGYDACRILTEERQVHDPAGEDFTYLWEQAEYEPVTGRLVSHIHFRFSDDSVLERAFSYDWRLWSLPEVRELLSEAGFSRVLVYWQGWDAEGRPDGRFVPVQTGEPAPGWIAYLTAEK